MESFYKTREWFDDGKVIHQARNTLSEVLLQENKFVIKSFKIPNAFSRVIYSYFRPSKARRSFENTLVFQEKGFNVPAPVAYLEFFSSGLLRESYYISEKVEADCTLHQVSRGQTFSWQEILPKVIELAYQMHQKGIIHKDFSHGNILIKQVEMEFQFYFVDLNRLYKGQVSFENGLKSLVRLIDCDETIKLIASSYASCAGADFDSTYAALGSFYLRHKRRNDLKQKIKKTLGLVKK